MKVTGRVTREEVLMGRDKKHPLTPELEANLALLLKALNELRSQCPISFVVSSGYRPGVYNLKAGGAKRSAHLTCEAVDFVDVDGQLAAWCIKNVQLLEKAGLYMENSEFTPGWVHLQTRSTKNRIFVP